MNTLPNITLYVYRDNHRINVSFFSQQDVFKFGRLPSSSVPLTHDSVARMHAVIEITSEGIRLIDLGSDAGSIVNGEKVHKNVILQHGDVIVLGVFTIYFQVNHQPFDSPLGFKGRPGGLIEGFHCAATSPEKVENLIRNWDSVRAHALEWVDGYAVSLPEKCPSLGNYAVEKRQVGKNERDFFVKLPVDSWNQENLHAEPHADMPANPEPVVDMDPHDLIGAFVDLLIGGEDPDGGSNEPIEPQDELSESEIPLGLQLDPKRTSNARYPEIGDCWTATVKGSQVIVVVTNIDYSGNLRRIIGFVGGRAFDEYEKFFSSWLYSMRATPSTPIKNPVTPIKPRG